MDRRKFIISTSLSLGAVSVSKFGFAKENTGDKLKPKRLSKGDTIGLIAPGSGVGRSSFEKAIATIKRLGFTPYYTENLRVNNGFLGGTDQQRIDDIHHMFENDIVDGILCIRGGYGSNRLLAMIDYDLIKNNPKLFMGYSDITALLYGIYSQTGLTCFHGPVGVSSFKGYAENTFVKEVVSAKKGLVIKRPKSWVEKDNKAFNSLIINRGKAQGVLIGGNLSVLVALIGTPYDIDFSDKILFLEEIGEPPYKIDRMLTQLLLSGKLAQLKGIALGVFIDCDDNPEDEDYDKSISLEEVLKERLADLNIPIMYGLPFGHISDNATIPFGVRAELNTEKESLTLLESVVV